MSNTDIVVPSEPTQRVLTLPYIKANTAMSSQKKLS